MYAENNDYVFASAREKGKQPRTGGILVTDHIRPSAIAAGVLVIRGRQGLLRWTTV